MPKSKSDHIAFVELHREFGNKFKGYYYRSSSPVHCKVYSWYHNDTPIIGFAGSANYSQYGFFKHLQVNQLTNDDPVEIKTLFDELLINSVYIPDEEVVLPQYHRTPHPASIAPGKIQNRFITICCRGCNSCGRSCNHGAYTVAVKRQIFNLFLAGRKKGCGK